jgi:hypothetical protein
VEKDTLYVPTLLPDTKGKLLAIGDEIYHFDKYIMALRDAFVHDFSSLPAHMQLLLLKNERLIADPVLKSIVLDALYLSQRIAHNDTFGLIIHEFASGDSYILQSSDSRLAHTKGIIILSEFLWSALLDDQGKFITRSQFMALMQNENTRCIFFKLLYTKASTIHYYNSTPLDSILPIDNSKLESQLHSLVNIGSDLMQLVDELKERRDSKKDIAFQDYAHYVDLVVDLVNFGSRVATSGPDKSASHDFFKYLDHASAFSIKVKRKEYSSALLDLKALVSMALIGPSPASTDTAARNLYIEKTNALQALLRYTSFLAAVAEAQDGDAVAQAIESFVLPAGSSVTKRRSEFSLALNAYTGVIAGREFRKHGTQNANSGIFGISAPFGVSMNRGYKSGTQEKFRNSCGVFVSLIDIGAVFLYRFKEGDKIADLPEITLQNIVAPGIFAETSIANSPVTIGAGYQWSPGLREITNKDGMAVVDKQDLGSGRLIVTLKLDLPLLYLARREPQLKN